MTPLASRLALIVVTDPGVPAGLTLVEAARAALRGGAPSIQLRAKHTSAREAAQLARELLAETRAAGAHLFVNDRVDIALAAGAGCSVAWMAPVLGEAIGPGGRPARR